MEIVDQLRQAILTVIFWAGETATHSQPWKIVRVQDIQRDHYILQHIDFANDKYNTHLLAYLEI